MQYNVAHRVPHTKVTHKIKTVPVYFVGKRIWKKYISIMKLCHDKDFKVFESLPPKFPRKPPPPPTHTSVFHYYFVFTLHFPISSLSCIILSILFLSFSKSLQSSCCYCFQAPKVSKNWRFTIFSLFLYIYMCVYVYVRCTHIWVLICLFSLVNLLYIW